MNLASNIIGGVSPADLVKAAGTYLGDGRYAAAIGVCERALQADPTSAEPLLLLGLVSFEMDQPAQALTFLGQAHSRKPTVREYADALATVHARIGNMNEGLFYAKLATTLQPDSTLKSLVPPRYSNFFASVEQAQPHRFRGRAEFLLAHGYIAATVIACEKQLELTPDDIETQRILATALRRDGQTTEAIAIGHRLMHGEAPSPKDALELARSLSNAGLFEEASGTYDFVLNRWGYDPSIASEGMSNSIRNPDATATAIQTGHKAWVRGNARRVRWDAPFGQDRDPSRALRIGYLFTELGSGNLPDLIAPAICRHKGYGHATYVYANGPGSDPLSERVRRHIEKWTDLCSVDHETAAEILRGDGIDIAIDLTSHGIGSHRLTLARHPTPVSFAWLADPLPGDDAIDRRLVAEGSSGTRDTRTSRLSTLAPYLAPTTAPDISDLPAQRLNHITFGAALDLTSIGSKTASLWANLIAAIPGSRLLIANAARKDQSCIERCVSRFDHYGLRDRVDIVNIADNFQDDLEFYHHIDVALDGYPVSHLPELYRALWMGVPVLSAVGRDGGVGAATLKRFGASDWTGASVAKLVQAARKLCANPESLARLRATLRDRMRKSAITDVDSFVQELEKIYRSAWSDWCRQASH